MQALVALGLISTASIAAAAAPSVASAELVGYAQDPRIDRDSCTSTRVGARELWTCRDSESYPGAADGFFYSSTASWTDFNADGTLPLTGGGGGGGNLTMYGNNTGAYFPVPSDMGCAQDSGACANSTRLVIWPDSPPLPVEVEDDNGSGSGSDSGGGKATRLYSWIKNARITDDLVSLTAHPSTNLYRADYTAGADDDAVPPAALLIEEFWAAGRPAYGDYGWVVRDGTAYLYALLGDGTSSSTSVGLARVATADIEDPSRYQYYDPSSGNNNNNNTKNSNGTVVGSSWTATQPLAADTSKAVPNAGTGQQGTFFHSEHLGRFVWIGSPSPYYNAEFWVTTAPAPEGPWDAPALLFDAGPGGSAAAGYSQQAHPGLGRNASEVYLSYTRLDEFYSTPLVRVVWA
ncbi:hypothetical protein GGR56DRAFT_685478 [Xylariaceae sp. FL0804]|nr:hypothetical protein GGR56DRAFT_685478 [Xylariaceae sp. FL0804]